MPVFVAWLLAGIGSALASWVARLIFSFGVSMVFTSVALPPLRSYLAGMTSGLPATTIQLFGYMGIDKGLTMILSALVIAAASRVSLRKKGV
jgi:type II secretory pathway component PulF